MARPRQFLVNVDRMRQEMDELLGDPWGRPRPGAFVPRADVYYCGSEDEEAGPRAVVKFDLAGVDPAAVNLEISGRELVILGQRPVRETEGRAYQQVEIPTGQFRRRIKLGVEIVAEQATATFEDGILRIELPLRTPEQVSRRVPIERPD